ncbi:hypothetical protein PBY51_000160 [Eleginops maclovinus]|uniref:Uncharacterized protein n=1 Tax=Eleginops maclovinus TaxID=56733 RepID=A0AAN7XJB3_ELEMC|nr:hypothetical protein PBY51_000160 [Eleginops maclovinus]
MDTQFICLYKRPSSPRLARSLVQFCSAPEIHSGVSSEESQELRTPHRNNAAQPRIRPATPQQVDQQGHCTTQQRSELLKQHGCRSLAGGCALRDASVTANARLR